MTRKRFVKLLMAKGYSRNTANGMATLAQAKGYSYEKAYRGETAIPNLVDSLAPAIAAMAETIGKMAAALAAGFSAFGEAYRAAMEAEREQVEAEKYGGDRNQVPVDWEARWDALMEAAT